MSWLKNPETREILQVEVVSQRTHLEIVFLFILLLIRAREEDWEVCILYIVDREGERWNHIIPKWIKELAFKAASQKQNALIRGNCGQKNLDIAECF